MHKVTLEQSKSFQPNNVFLPFVYSAMDAACLSQSQSIYACQREQKQESVRESLGVSLKKLNTLPTEP